MKKYVAPSVEVKKYDIQNILAVSMYNEEGNGIQLSKSDIWGEDEDDEDF